MLNEIVKYSELTHKIIKEIDQIYEDYKIKIFTSKQIEGLEKILILLDKIRYEENKLLNIMHGLNSQTAIFNTTEELNSFISKKVISLLRLWMPISEFCFYKEAYVEEGLEQLITLIKFKLEIGDKHV